MRLVFQGIKDLDSNPQSWGVVTTIGQRSNKGVPTDTDKFFIKRPNAVPKKFGSRTGLVRENDPEFAQFNKSDNVKLRSALRFQIAHPTHMREGWASMFDTFQFNLYAQQIPRNPKHPRQGPACSGDGEKARRWDGEEYKDIECPNRLCKFRTGKPAPCKPKAKLIGRLTWPEHEAWSTLPTPIAMLQTGSWHNIGKVLVPFFKNLHEQAIALGYPNYNFYGLSMRITLAKRAVSGGGLVPAIAISSEQDFREFLQQQHGENDNEQSNTPDDHQAPQ